MLTALTWDLAITWPYAVATGLGILAIAAWVLREAWRDVVSR